MRTRRKTAPSAPSGPEALARLRAKARAEAADPASWGVNAPGLALDVNQAIRAVRSPRGVVVRAHRQDVLDRLYARGALSEPALGALRRLQADFASLHRTGLGVRDFGPRVDVQPHPGDFGQGRLEAGGRIRTVLGLTGPASAKLLRAFCEAAIVQGVDLDWRAVIEAQTTERLADAQAAVLRAAAENLVGAYQALDRARRAARAA